MATTADVKRTPSGRLTYRGETFAGYNKTSIVFKKKFN